MDKVSYNFNIADSPHQLELAWVEGGGEKGFWFGEDTHRFPVHVKGFFMATCSVTQALWKHIMGDDANLSHFKQDSNPVEHVSWDDINQAGGFLDKINSSNVLNELKKQLPTNSKPLLRLPSETEWEYAARGGIHWRENLLFSGSDNPDEVAWFKANSKGHTWPVGKKAPNQLGIYDLCGNVWEWCLDIYNYNTDLIPRDGTPYLGSGTSRILRGGCHHNGAVHCTVSKRYEIVPDAKDECIGFRMVLDF